MPDLAFRLTMSGVDGELVDRIKAILSSSGMTVLGSSLRGIDARAPRPVIERFFQAPVRDRGSASFLGEPKFTRLPDGPTYRTYFPRPPDLF